MAKFYRTEDRTVLLELFGAGSSVENLKNLKANTTDAAVEKHVPVVTQEGNKITVAVFRKFIAKENTGKIAGVHTQCIVYYS